LYAYEEQQLHSAAAAPTPSADGAGARNHGSSALWSSRRLR